MSTAIVSPPPPAVSRADPPPGRLPRDRAARGLPWERLALLAVLVVAGVLFLWGVTRNGMSNEYYAAAVKSGTESWKAWFFGSLDPGSFITVDKPPLALWLMGLSGRLFGFSSASMLIPQGLAMLGAVALLHATVKRAWSAQAGIAAALALATTPAIGAVARVNNPDALLVLLLVLAGYLTVRAIRSGRTLTLVGVGAVVGLAFMTKMLQGWMIVPALGAAYLLAGPLPLRRRLGQLLAAGAAMVVVSGAWPLAVALWPGSAPYIGGSTDGSAWDLILGYNGLGRIFGEGGGGGGGGAGFGGVAGAWRLFNAQVGGQIAWLLPAAAVGLGAGLWLTRRAPRTDARRALVVLFGLWAVVHVLIFSFAEGTFHPYYTSALAPGVAVLAGTGVVALWQAAQTSWVAHGVLAVTVLGTAALSIVLLERTPDFAPWLKLVVGVAAVLAVVASSALRLGGLRGLAALAAVAGTIAVLAGPTAYSAANLGRALDGNNVTAGPASASSTGGPGGGMGTPPDGASSGTRPTGGGMGGALSDEAIAYLQANQGSAKYLVAASGSQTTASIILATGEPVVTFGGFTGSDAAPTVSELSELVSSGQLKYVYVSSGGGGMGGGSSNGSELTAWVQAHGEAVTHVTVSGGTLYEVSAS